MSTPTTSRATAVTRRAIIPSVLVMFFFICAGRPPGLRADPISYTITWTLTQGSTAPHPTTTEYTYDASTNQYGAFVVLWNTAEFDAATVLNKLTVQQRSDFQAAILNSDINPWVGFHFAGTKLFFQISDDPFGIVLEAAPNGTPSTLPSFGTFAVTQTTVPEPATLTLCGIGVGGLFLTRYARSKRRKRPHK